MVKCAEINLSHMRGNMAWTFSRDTYGKLLETSVLYNN